MTRPTNLLLTGGHAHDFAATAQVVADLLATEGVTTEITQSLEDAFARMTAGARFDLLTVAAVRFRMLPERYAPLRGAFAFEMDSTGRRAILDHLGRGGGLLALHTAPICFDDWPEWGAIFGAVWDWDRSGHPPPLPSLVSVTGEVHPVTDGIDDFEVVDEIYHSLTTEPDVTPLAVSPHEGRPQPLVWTRTRGPARVAVDLLGHSRASLEHPAHATIVLRAALWALGRGDAEVSRAWAAPTGRHA